ncbi:CmcJ/NvfI family oxidoreductase [Leisingera aquimarina]|uniref:CmcJ/NvfI family oxidoreductase n=1 Tax=Leisingera aquimarina TaxID=476529 RepID=UPI00041A4997|nr:CmcJ/NvfI family oxidoreductase [Leisingera aquimarina]
MAVRDVRRSEAGLSFEGNSVGFTTFPTDVQFFVAGMDWQDTYDKELSKLLTSEIGAQEVIVFDHTVRVDDPNADRAPARNVHSDYSADGAKRRLVDILGEDKAAEWSKGHFAFINLWRPIGAAINSAPLGFICPSSVADDDWILLDLIYPDRKGQIMGVAANPDHDWLYLSKMTPDEIAFFNIFDNRGLPSIAHSALDMVEDPNIHTVRRSIESRTLVRYAA